MLTIVLCIHGRTTKMPNRYDIANGRITMQRRDFLKLGVTTGIAALVPIHFIIDNRDAETKFMEYAVCNYNEMQVLCLIKEYGWVMSKGQITKFFAEFSERQPEVVKWLKERI